jgi:hypothetical protein
MWGHQQSHHISRQLTHLAAALARHLLPGLAAHVAELVAAIAGDVVAALLQLYHVLARSALAPAAALRQLQQRHVLWLAHVGRQLLQRSTEVEGRDSGLNMTKRAT